MANAPDDRTAEQAALEALSTRLRGMLRRMEALENRHTEELASRAPDLRDSSRNLLHYLALRRADARQIQSDLAALGLSSLGRCEGQVQANLAAVAAVVDRLRGVDHGLIPRVRQGPGELEQRATALLGETPAGRPVRMMVTMPSRAAEDPALIRDLLRSGMNLARINCAHDDADTWTRIARLVRRLARDTGLPCRVLMDLAGPKLRTGPLRPGPAVLKIRPEKDALGVVVRPARVWIAPESEIFQAPPDADAVLPLAGGWVRAPRRGDRLRFADARGKERRLEVTGAAAGGVWATCARTAYVLSGTLLRLTASGRRADSEWLVGTLPSRPETIRLQTGDRLVLTRSLEPGHAALPARQEYEAEPATIGCTLPELFRDAQVDEPVWFDDGKIGGVIERKGADELIVRVTQAPPGGARLGPDKGINLPLTRLRIGALTDKDLSDLDVISREADVVALSFVENPADLRRLRRELDARGGRCKGVVLKIETRRAFANLPSLLLELLREPLGGVMIARGDLAVECGFERLAEVQEEILWLCEAAQVPVIWATQVLETLARKGVASRAEITDAAMSNRAECVMLNKGPFITAAARSLDDILRRMAGHQVKKRPMLRPLSVAGRDEPETV